MTSVQEMAITQLKEVLRLIESGEREVTRVNTGFYKGQATDLSISLWVQEEEQE